MENAASDSFSLDFHFSSAHFKTTQSHASSLESKHHQDVAVHKETDRCRWQNKCQWHRRCSYPTLCAAACGRQHCNNLEMPYRKPVRWRLLYKDDAQAIKSAAMWRPRPRRLVHTRAIDRNTFRYVPPIAWAACADSGPAARWPPVSAATGGSSSPSLLAPFSAAGPSDASASASVAELPCCCVGPAAASA